MTIYNCINSTIKYITTIEASEMAKVTPDTIINWCKRYSIGRKVGGRWKVNHSKLIQLIKGEFFNGENS